MRLATESADAPAAAARAVEGVVVATAQVCHRARPILAGLWWGIPKIVWPATPLPHIPVRGGRNCRRHAAFAVGAEVQNGAARPGESGGAVAQRGRDRDSRRRACTILTRGQLNDQADKVKPQNFSSAYKFMSQQQRRAQPK